MLRILIVNPSNEQGRPGWICDVVSEIARQADIGPIAYKVVPLDDAPRVWPEEDLVVVLAEPNVNKKPSRLAMAYCPPLRLLVLGQDSERLDLWIPATLRPFTSYRLIRGGLHAEGISEVLRSVTPRRRVFTTSREHADEERRDLSRHLSELDRYLHAEL